MTSNAPKSTSKLGKPKTAAGPDTPKVRKSKQSGDGLRRPSTTTVPQTEPKPKPKRKVRPSTVDLNTGNSSNARTTPPEQRKPKPAAGPNAPKARKSKNEPNSPMEGGGGGGGLQCSQIAKTVHQMQSVAAEYAAMDANINWGAARDVWEKRRRSRQPSAARTWLDEFVLNPRVDPIMPEETLDDDDDDEDEEDDIGEEEEEIIKAEMADFIVDDEECSSPQ
jgi:hypothetical protein